MDNAALLALRNFSAPEIVYGRRALELAGRHAANLGASRAMIVTDPGVQEAGWAGRVEASLSSAAIPYTVFNAVTPNPKDHEVMAGADIFRREGCDLIVAVGGGSPMDCAKGIGVVAGNDDTILRFEGVDEIPEPGPPLVFIPTTAGSSADVSQFCIITDTARRVKIAIVSKMVIPDISLVDPQTTVTMPPDLTANTGMDALCHAFEAFVSTAHSPLTDMAAIEAVRLVSSHLLGAFRQPDDMVHRDGMMMASLMAGLAFSNASLGLVHAMAHSLGGGKDLAHGECNAMLLEAVVAFNYPSAPHKYMRLAQALGIDTSADAGDDTAALLIQRIAALRRQLSITERLQHLGIKPSDLTPLARFAERDPCLSTNPREADAAQIERIFQTIY